MVPASEPLRGDATCDVVVLGGGLAGRGAAIALAERGADVVVLGLHVRSRRLSGSGLLLRGLFGDASEYRENIAGRDIDALDAMAKENAAIVTRLCGVMTNESGAPTLVNAAVLRDGASPPAAEDLVVDLPAFGRGLDERMRMLGIRVVEGEPVIALDSSAMGVVASSKSATVRASRAVLALGAWLPAFDPWVAACARAGRAQYCVTAPYARSVTPRVVRNRVELAQHGRDGSGRIVAIEGSVIADRGDAFDAAPDSMVQARLEEVILGAAPGATIEERGALPRLYTCDGLPLVGPHPMRASCVLVAGFNGFDLSLAFAAGRIATDWIVDGRPRDDRSLRFSPRRML